jgi:pimeloyl-ACP methyl ester carboxylesterase
MAKQRSFRFERAGNETAVVFVHGLWGDACETWGNFPDLLYQDSSLKHCDIIGLGFPSPMLPRIRIPFLGSRTPTIPLLADRLRSALGSHLFGGKYKDLVLVGHSMGGLVIMEMIINALAAVQEDSQLLDRIRHVLLFATPTDGVQIPTILKLHPQAKALSCDDAFLSTLRSQWINRVYAVRSEDPRTAGKRYIPTTVVAGDADNTVPSESVKAFFTNTEMAPGNHFEVCKPQTRDHISYRILGRIIHADASILPKLMREAMVQKNHSSRVFEIFKPVADSELSLWAAFRGTYYAWNSTWNYELRSPSQEARKRMFDVHRSRLQQDELKQIHYVVFDADVPPLLSSFEHLQHFFTALYRETDNRLFEKVVHKYRIYRVTEQLLKLLDKPYDKALYPGTSLFIGTINGRETMILFINSRPFMDELGRHVEAYRTTDSELIDWGKAFIEGLMAQCYLQHGTAPEYVYRVNFQGKLEPIE